MIPPGTPVRLTAPKPSTNTANPEHTPIQEEGTAGVLQGSHEGNHNWRLMTVTFEVPVREEDIEPILDAEHDGDVDDTPIRPVPMDDEAE